MHIYLALSKFLIVASANLDKVMLFKTSKEIAIIGLSIALLIALQYIFYPIKGIELVTVFILCFCFSFGMARGIICAVGFSLLRCFIFGFFPNVILLYLIYYPLFALACGLLGRFFKSRKKQTSLIAYIIMVVTACIFTCLFTLIDNLITVIMMSYNYSSALAYFAASIPVMLTQCVCALVSTAVLFYPLTKVFLSVNERLVR